LRCVTGWALNPVMIDGVFRKRRSNKELEAALVNASPQWLTDLTPFF